jgi:putative restriction endonuclease
VILAKPITILAILDYIDKELTENRIDFEGLCKYYKLESARYNNTTPFQYPYFFLSNEEFYHLKWKGIKVKKKAPSAMFIRDNIEYAYLDNALWDLLQDVETREYFKERIINAYLQ